MGKEKPAGGLKSESRNIKLSRYIRLNSHILDFKFDILNRETKFQSQVSPLN